MVYFYPLGYEMGMRNVASAVSHLGEGEDVGGTGRRTVSLRFYLLCSCYPFDASARMRPVWRLCCHVFIDVFLAFFINAHKIRAPDPVGASVCMFTSESGCFCMLYSSFQVTFFAISIRAREATSITHTHTDTHVPSRFPRAYKLRDPA